MASSLPPNAHVSSHPCLRAKLSQLRSQSTNARETRSLIHEIATIVGCEALGQTLQTKPSGTDKSPLGYPYETETIAPSHISLVPILRSGLSMVEPIQSLLPQPVPVHHLGLYREKTTLQPVEYYNNLPYHSPSAYDPAAVAGSAAGGPSDLAVVLDPIIATGATASAAISSLQEWGVGGILVVGVLASVDGLRRACEVWPEGVQVWVGACDADVDGKGMIKPGLGDVGDRLFLTIGK